MVLSPPARSLSAAVDTPEEIVVVGRLSGPLLWRVSKGDNVLWIFPYLSPVPRDMSWDNERVARVIASSQEYIGMPEINADTSPLLLVNPVNWVRGYRLMKRLQRHPDGASLEQAVGLTSDTGITDTIRKLVKRNRTMVRTDVAIEIDLEGSFELLRADGYLDALRDRGYDIREP